MGVISAAVQMVFPRYVARWGWPGRMIDERSYEQSVGDGTNSSLVDTLVSFIVHGFTQMYPVVAVSEPDEVDYSDLQANHPAARLFRRPVYEPDLGYSWYSWMTMIAGICVSFIADGNGYLLKIRSGSGRVVQLWYIPHFMIEPRWDAFNSKSPFITCYDYAPTGMRLTEGPQSFGSAEGPIYQLRPKDLIHLRDGLDPSNPRKGFSKLKKLLREIYTDEEAARFTASLLRNNGVPGVVISPTSEKGWIVDGGDADRVRQRIESDFTGDNRGRPMVMRGPTKVEHYSWSPEQLNLRAIRAVPEERISAAIGVPAAVAGFGAGLEHTKVGRTMSEFVDLAWQNGILPRARIFASELTEQYLGEFDTGAGSTADFAFDTTRVPIMAEYHKLQAERHSILVNASIEDRATAKRALGQRIGPRDNVYIIGAGSQEVPSDKTMDEAPAAQAVAAGVTANVARAKLKAIAPSAGNGNGNGHGSQAVDETVVVAGS